MKKVVNFLLVLFLVAGSTGISVSKHYCMGLLRDVAVNQHAKGCDLESSMPIDCCEDEIERFGVEDELQLTLNFKNTDASLFLVRIIDYSEIIAGLNQINSGSMGNSNVDPPPLPGVHIFVRVQSFLL